MKESSQMGVNSKEMEMRNQSLIWRIFQDFKNINGINIQQDFREKIEIMGNSLNTKVRKLECLRKIFRGIWKLQ